MKPFDLDRALPYLMPVQSVDDTAPLVAYGSNDAPISRPFSGGLRVNYMIDEPGAVMFVRERDVDEARREELHARSLGNLRAHVARRKLRFERVAQGAMHLLKLDGMHEANLLLLDELWEGATRIADLEGDVVASVPSRDVLAFTGLGIPGGVRELQAGIERVKGRPLTADLFVRRDRGWQLLGS